MDVNGDIPSFYFSAGIGINMPCFESALDV